MVCLVANRGMRVHEAKLGRLGSLRKIFLCATLCLLLSSSAVYAFNIKPNPLLFVDLTSTQNRTTVNGLSKPVFNYPPTLTDSNERFKLIQTDSKKSNYVMFGARNRIVVIFKNPHQYGSPLQVYESYFPNQGSTFKNRNCSDRACANYILTSLPLNKSKYNILICGTYYGLFQCLQAEQNKKTGLIESYDELDSLFKAPKSINLPLSNENALHLSFNTETSDYVLYAATSWTDTSQYLSAHVSDNNYQDDNLSKKIGVSKSFVKFVEAKNRLFLFQNELSYDIDDGEKDRDILISTSLVTQICKNDQDIVNREALPFYSELTAKIYCFNGAFRSSGNSRMFKFDSLDYVTDLISLKTTNQTKKLFYGVFNTPKNQITGTAICLFDIDDLEFVFQKQNFKFLDDNNENAAKNTQLNPQDCPKLSYMEKLKYKSFTSKLSYMTKSALPVRKRKASFMTTNDYRITCLFVLDDHVTRPVPNHFKSLHHMNVIYAGTDNGKLLRIVHHFSDGFFYNDEADEERVEILEEIQLFDKQTKINQISLLNDAASGIPDKLVVNSDDQIKVISIDFCELYSDSCETCLKLNRMSEKFRSKCMWRNDSCKTASSNANLMHLESCDFLTTTMATWTSPTTTTTTTTSSRTTKKTPTTSTKSIQVDTLTTQRQTSSLSSSGFSISALTSEEIREQNGGMLLPVDANEHQTEFDTGLEFLPSRGGLNLFKNGSSPNLLFATDYNRAQSLDAPHLHSTPGSNVSSLGQSMLRKNKSDVSSTQSNEIVLLIIVAVIASLCMLILGILIGYALKAKYSKVIVKKFDSFLSKKRHGGSGTPTLPKRMPTSSISSSESGITNNSTERKFNPYQYSQTQPSSGKESSRNNSSASSNTSVHQTLSSSKQHLIKPAPPPPPHRIDYFTVQNDYGLLPPINGRNYAIKVTAPPPIAPPQLPVTSPLQHRLSSTSSSSTADSSASSTSSSYSGVAYNLLNSQTCLLNSVVGIGVAGSSLASQPAMSSKQSNINSSSEVASETTTSTHISPVSRLVLSTTTTGDSSYPAAEVPNSQNCIVVNDDDEEENMSATVEEENRIHSSSSPSSSSSSSNPTKRTNNSKEVIVVSSNSQSRPQSQNPSSRSSSSTSTSSSSTTTNWASLTRISHQNRYFKHHPQHRLNNYPSSNRPPSSSSNGGSNNFYRPAAAEAAVYAVKTRLTSLLNDEFSPPLPIKVDDTSIYLNNSYV